MAVVLTSPVPATLQSVVTAARPRQWVKNLLVAGAPLAAGQLTDPWIVLQTVFAIACFCAASSAVYLVNDVRDVEADRNHPTKSLRPIAAGLLSPRVALCAAALLAAAALAGASTIAPGYGVLIAAYLGVQAAYGMGLKHEPVFDIAIVASGFLMRAIGGGLATGIPLSRWFLIVAAFGSLFMVAGKRYSELLVLGDDAGTRASLKGYTISYLRFVWSLSAGVAIAAYCLWAFGLPDGTPAYAELSIIPFVIGILRYALDIDAGRADAPEEIVLGDRGLQLLGLCWVVLIALGAFSVAAL